MNISSPPRNMLMHQGFAVPHDLVQTHGPLDEFQQTANANIAVLRRFCGLDHARWITEIGCGVGQHAMGLSHILPIDARYFGTDPSPEPITWAQKNITAQVPNFWFFPMQVGLDGIGPATLPLDDGSQDLVFSFTLGTGVYPDALALHLREFNRVLQPGGTAILSCYVIRPGLIQHLHAHPNRQPGDATFLNMVERGFYLDDPANPQSRVGYSPRKLGSMARRARLVPTKFIKGGWSQEGHSEIDGPDAVILTKPVF